jgi:hypothetical protein
MASGVGATLLAHMARSREKRAREEVVAALSPVEEASHQNSPSGEENSSGGDESSGEEESSR